MIFHIDQALQLTPTEWIKVFWYGLQMDLSMGGYFMLLTGVLLCLSILLNKNLTRAVQSTNKALIIISSLLTIADAELYLHWGFRITTAPLLYLDKEAMGTLPVMRYVMLLILWLVLTVLATAFYRHLVHSNSNELKHIKRLNASALLLLTLLLIVPIRGSFQVSTMNVSRVYFHPDKPFANHAGINAVWNFMYSALRSQGIKYPEDFFNPQLTKRYFSELYPRQDSTITILNTNKPNILLIILEGISTDVIEPLGGLPGITPNLNRLCSEGLVFDRFYASGDRTDKGLVSLLTAYPAQPRGSIIKYVHKTAKLYYLSSALVNMGYKTSFVYGGDVDFANYRSLFTNGRFAHLTSLEDFPDSIPTNKWGVHDEHLYAQMMYELDTTSRFPFFKVALTLSSHEPFNVPMAPVFTGNTDSVHYLNAAFYADRCLGEFLNKEKKRDWWNQTLVVITADHGHRLPAYRQPEQPEKYHIPMIWTGGLITQNKVIGVYGSQTDLANTLLGQISNPDENFIFSRNLLGKPLNNFTVFVYNEGFGYITPDAELVYDLTANRLKVVRGHATETDINRAKAYMQKLFFDYNSK